MHLFLKELKYLHLSGNLSPENILKLSICSYGYTPFCFTNLNYLPLNSCDKYLKSLSDKILTNASRLKFIHCMLSIKTEFLLIVKAMYFSNPFGITLTFTSDLPISHIIKQLS